MNKTLKTTLFICLILLLSTTLGACKIFKYEVHAFSLSDYEDYLETYSLDEKYDDIRFCGKIESASDAVEKAKDVMKTVYGESALGIKAPYSVYYDEYTDAWLVIGSTLFLRGNGAHVIIDGETGEILAVWNYKF